VDVAVAGALLAKMRNGGEACTAANRLYVHRSLVAEFTEKLGAAIGALSVGPGMTGAAVGPLVNAAAVEKVDELVQEAVARGARAARERGARVGDGRDQPRRRLGPRSAVRWGQAVRDRARGWPRGAARVHRGQVHRGRLVTGPRQERGPACRSRSGTSRSVPGFIPARLRAPSTPRRDRS